MRQGGYAVVSGLLPPQVLAALQREAQTQRHLAQDVCVRGSAPINEAQRGGSPARKLLSAPGAAVQQALYADPRLARTLSTLTGLPVAPTASEAGGSFSYYCRPGDFLSIHRDIVSCDVALITCLQETGSIGGAGKLCLYPTRLWEPLSELRNEPLRGATPIRLSPGHSAVVLGGVVPHCTLPVAAAQCRVVSLLCYRALLS